MGILCGLFSKQGHLWPPTKHSGLHSYFAISRRAPERRNQFSTPLWRSRPAAVSVFLGRKRAESPNEGEFLCGQKKQEKAAGRRGGGQDGEPRLIQADCRGCGGKGGV